MIKEGKTGFGSLSQQTVACYNNEPGNYLLSHSFKSSIIGLEGLNFRVRNGTGCGPFSIATWIQETF